MLDNDHKILRFQAIIVGTSFDRPWLLAVVDIYAEITELLLLKITLTPLYLAYTQLYTSLSPSLHLPHYILLPYNYIILLPHHLLPIS